MVLRQLAMLEMGVQFSSDALMTTTRVVLGSLIALMFMAMLGFYYLVPRHASQSARENIYHIDQSYDRVRKILTRTNSLEEIVAHQHGEVIHQDWGNLNISADRLRGPWNVNGVGEFIVKSEDPEAGTLILHFRQKVYIGPDYMTSEASLVSPVGNLKEYNTFMRMERDGDRTVVRNRISLKYERRLPKGYIEYMDKKVGEAAERGLDKGREAMLNLCSKYANKKFIIPIKR